MVLGGDLGVRDEIQENYLPNLTEGRKKTQYETAFKIPPLTFVVQTKITFPQHLP